MSGTTYGEPVSWHPERPKYRPLRLLLSWLLSAAALLIAAAIVPGVSVEGFGGAVLAALLIAVLNAILPPIVAGAAAPVHGAARVRARPRARRADAPSGLGDQAGRDPVDNFGWALLAALVAAAVGVVLDVVFGTNDDDTYTLQGRPAHREAPGRRERTDVPGIVFLEIDGLALPVLRRAMRDGNAPNMARWLAEGSYALDRSGSPTSPRRPAPARPASCSARITTSRRSAGSTSRPAASSPARGRTTAPRSSASGRPASGCSTNGGSSRGNLLSGEADEVILTVSRISEEKKSNPGYRAFFANGFNVTRSLVLFFWEIVLEVTAAHARSPPGRPPAWPPERHLPAAARDDVRRRTRPHRLRRPHGHDARPACDLRDVLELRRGRPPLRARAADTLEALRKLDQQFGRIENARRYAPRPYEIVVLSDHGQTQGATFKQRNGYGLDDLVERSLASGSVHSIQGGDEQACDGRPRRGRGDGYGRQAREGDRRTRSGDRQVVVLGSGNLGLVYLMEEPRRLTLEEIEERHPQLLPALREHPHVGWILVRSRDHGALALGGGGIHYLEHGTRRRRRPARAVRARTRRTTCGARTASRTSPTS